MKAKKTLIGACLALAASTTVTMATYYICWDSDIWPSNGDYTSAGVSSHSINGVPYVSAYVTVWEPSTYYYADHYGIYSGTCFTVDSGYFESTTPPDDFWIQVVDSGPSDFHYIGVYVNSTELDPDGGGFAWAASTNYCSFYTNCLY